MVKIMGKPFKQGNSYAIRIPKNFIDNEVFNINDEIILEYVGKKKIENNLNNVANPDNAKHLLRSLPNISSANSNIDDNNYIGSFRDSPKNSREFEV